MAFSCGFYNAVNHDRTYNANQFGDLFTGLINDGVYATVGHAMTVAPVGGMTVKVRSGRAWFNKTWNVNDSDYPLTIPESDLLLPRIDAVILEVDTRVSVRNNSLRVVKGYPANNPSYPTLTRANGLYQYPLAYVNVRANVTNITTGDIEVVVGRNPTPFVTGIVGTADISDFWEQWDGQFHEWFDELRTNMSGDVAQNLQAQIEALKVNMITNDRKASTSQAQSGTNDTTWMTPAKTLAFYNYRIASQAEVQAELPTENTHIVTPLRLKNYMDAHKWNYSSQQYNEITWVSSSGLDGYYRSQAAVKSDYPGETVKYITPNVLSQILSNSQPTITEESGNGTITADRMQATISSSSIKFYKYGPIVTIYYDIGFTATKTEGFFSLLISGVPVPKDRYIMQGPMPVNGQLASSLMFAMECQQAPSDTPMATIASIRAYNGNFESGNGYLIAGSATYYS